MGAFSVIYNTPLFYQVALNLSSAEAGLRLIPTSVASSLGSLSYGIIMAKTVCQFYAYLILGTVLLARNQCVCISNNRDRAASNIQHINTNLAAFCLYYAFRIWFRCNYNPTSHCSDLLCSYRRSLLLYTFSNPRPSHCHRNELFIPKYWLSHWNHSNPMHPPKSPQSVAYSTYSRSQRRICTRLFRALG